MWKSVYDSVSGTSHQRGQIPCQDACRVLEVSLPNETILIACSADGAGSASHSADGAELACDKFVELVRSHFEFSIDETNVGRDLALKWCASIRSQIELQALELEIEMRQMACTFLAAIVGEHGAQFLQIGDGAIVTWNGEHYCPVFWPHSGEYVNTTYFLTDEGFADNLEWLEVNESVHELAMFSDGLERLILRFADRSVHDPFLAPLFSALRQADNVDGYFEKLRLFLDSPKVNERTDDDKTLILATRMSLYGHDDDAVC